MTSPRYFPDDWTLPALTEHNAAFFTSGELRLETCRACGATQHPPVGVCIACGGLEQDYVAAEPHGVIDGYTIVHHAVHPLLRERVPYNVVVVALDGFDDIRIVGNVIDAAPDAIRMDAPVRGTWTEPLPRPDGTPAIRLLQWRIDEGGAG